MKQNIILQIASQSVSIMREKESKKRRAPEFSSNRSVQEFIVYFF
jgi:hypothetical protein